MEKIARLSLRGWKDVDIAQFLGVTPQSVYLDKKSPFYPAIEARTREGVSAEFDEELATTQNLEHRLRKHLVPAAFEALADAVLDKRVALKTRLDAASEILDRDGRFARVSRTGLAGEKQGGLISDKDSALADALVNALSGSKA